MDSFPAGCDGRRAVPMACQGCAAKVPAEPLGAALDRVGLGGQPEDASRLDDVQDCCKAWMAPALVSDPWLNGRLTALHACSDLWAAVPGAGAAAITLPMVPANGGRAAGADPGRHPLGAG